MAVAASAKHANPRNATPDEYNALLLFGSAILRQTTWCFPTPLRRQRHVQIRGRHQCHSADVRSAGAPRLQLSVRPFAVRTDHVCKKTIRTVNRGCSTLWTLRTNEHRPRDVRCAMYLLLFFVFGARTAIALLLAAFVYRKHVGAYAQSNWRSRTNTISVVTARIITNRQHLPPPHPLSSATTIIISPTLWNSLIVNTT
jgi:hypothetical protein